MTSSEWIIQLHRGSTYRTQLIYGSRASQGEVGAVLAPDGSTYYIPNDLTGFTARMGFRLAGETKNRLVLTDGAGITLGGSAGTIDIVVTEAQSRTIPETEDGIAQIELTAPSGDKVPLLPSEAVTLVVLPEVV